MNNTTIDNFEKMAANAAQKLNELLVTLVNIDQKPVTPAIGFDFDFIKIMDIKYPDDTGALKASKQYYYCFGLLQKYCYTLFYQEAFDTQALKPILTYIEEYFLKFDTLPNAHQTFFLKTDIGQNILHFCLIKLNNSSLWEKFLKLLKHSKYYYALNYCALLLKHPCCDEDNPLYAISDNLQPGVPFDFNEMTKTITLTKPTEAIINLVFDAKTNMPPSALINNPENIDNAADSYYQTFKLFVRAKTLSKHFGNKGIIEMLVNNYQDEVIFHYNIAYMREPFSEKSKFAQDIEKMAIDKIISMSLINWADTNDYEVRSIADIFSIKKLRTINEAQFIYNIIDSLILTLCCHKLFKKAYELLDSIIAVLVIPGYSALSLIQTSEAFTKLAPLTFVATLNPQTLTQDISTREAGLLALMGKKTPHPNYYKILSPLTIELINPLININVNNIENVQKFISIINFLKIPYFTSLIPQDRLKLKIHALQEGMINLFYKLLKETDLLNAHTAYVNMSVASKSLEGYSDFTLNETWVSIITIGRKIQSLQNINEAISLDDMREHFNMLINPPSFNRATAWMLSELFFSLLSELANIRLMQKSIDEHRILINLLHALKGLLNEKHWTRLYKKFDIENYNHHVSPNLFSDNKKTPHLDNESVVIPDDLNQSLSTLAKHINFPCALTGAAVYELLHKKTPYDYDILVFGPTLDELALTLSNHNYTFLRIGKKFEIIQLKLNTDEVLELSSIKATDITPESLLELQKKHYKGRDLRISSLFILINKTPENPNKIISFNDALKDAMKKRINLIDNPEKILSEDPVRVLRIFKWLLKDKDMKLGSGLNRVLEANACHWLTLFTNAQNINPGNKSRLTKGVKTLLTRASSFVDGLKLLNQFDLLAALCGISSPEINALIMLFESNPLEKLSIDLKWNYFAALSIKLFYNNSDVVTSPVMTLFFWRSHEYDYLNFIQDTLRQITPPRVTIFDENFLTLSNSLDQHLSSATINSNSL